MEEKQRIHLTPYRPQRGQTSITIDAIYGEKTTNPPHPQMTTTWSNVNNYM